MTDSLMKMQTDSSTDLKRQHCTVMCPFCRQISRWLHGRNNSSGKLSAKVNKSPQTRPYPPLFLLLLPHLNSPQLQTTSAPAPPKKSPSSQHNKSYILKSSCHNIRVFRFTDGFLLIFVSNSIFLNFNI